MRRGSLPTVWSGAAAGTLVTYGVFAIMAGVGAAAVVAARHGHPAVNDTGWTWFAIAAVVAIGASALCGGYVAGRMTGRRGTYSGLLVGICTAFVLAVTVAMVGYESGGVLRDALVARLQALGVPATRHEWGLAGAATAIGGFAVMLLAAIEGGIAGVRTDAELRMEMTPSIEETRTIDLRERDKAKEKEQAQEEARV